MQETIKSYAIQETSNYGLFRRNPFQPESRASESLVKKLMDSMQKMGFHRGFPLSVKPLDGRYIIIDGHHRLEAAKRLGIPVLFTECSDYQAEHRDIGIINAATKKWSGLDWIHYFTQMGNADAKRLLKLAEYYDYPPNILAQLLCRGNYSKKDPSSFSIQESRLDEMEQILKELQVCREFSFQQQLRFLRAYMKVRLLEGFSYERFSKKAVSHGTKFLKPRRGSNEYLFDLVDLYNHASPKASRLEYSSKDLISY